MLVPATEARAGSVGRAEEIVLAVAPGAHIVRVPFVMKERTGVSARRQQAWEVSAQAALDAYARGADTVAFATIGDPSIYSTFSYLADTVLAARPDTRVEVIPGIMAMQALAATAGVPLTEGDETLALVTLKHGVEDVATVAEHVDTVVAYKIGRHYAQLREHIAGLGDEVRSVVGVNVGLPDQLIGSAQQIEESPYFGAAIITRPRGRRGGRL